MISDKLLIAYEARRTARSTFTHVITRKSIDMSFKLSLKKTTAAAILSFRFLVVDVVHAYRRTPHTKSGEA
jgi:hypothetical protein